MMKSLKIGDLLARTPIVQGGMGVGISLSGLASAVANEGGVGVISSAGLGVIYRDYSPDYNIASIWGLREELRKAREKTRGIIGVNVMVAMSNFADMVKTAIQEKADIIFSGAGLPLNLPSFLTEGCRTKLAPIVSSARAAKLLCEKWLANYGYIPDAIVVEGPKAGGHLGYKADQIEDEHYSLEEILPPDRGGGARLRGGARLPYPGHRRRRRLHGRGHLQHSATGGPRGCRWAPASWPPKSATPIRRLRRATCMHARRISRSSSRRSVCRGVRSTRRFWKKVKAGLKRPKSCPFNCIKTCDVSRSPYCIMLALYNAFRGRLENGYAFCGANAWRTEKIQSVRELIASLRKEYESFSLRDRLFPNKG